MGIMGRIGEGRSATETFRELVADGWDSGSIDFIPSGMIASRYERIMASLIDGCVFLPVWFLDRAMDGFGLPQWIKLGRQARDDGGLSLESHEGTSQMPTGNVPRL